MPEIKYASATTMAGKRRQVWNGKAELTLRGGLKKHQLKKNKQGKIVSKKKSSKGLNEFMKAQLRAKRAGAASFMYNNKRYVRRTTGHLVYYKAR